MQHKLNVLLDQCKTCVHHVDVRKNKLHKIESVICKRLKQGNVVMHAMPRSLDGKLAVYCNHFMEK